MLRSSLARWTQVLRSNGRADGVGVWWLDGVRKDVVVSVSMAVYTGLLIAAVAVLADSE